MASGTQAAAQFFLGVKSTTGATLRALRAQYAQTISYVVTQNRRLRSSLQAGFSVMSHTAAGYTGAFRRPINPSLQAQNLGRSFSQLISHTIARIQGRNPGASRNAAGQFMWSPSWITFGRIVMSRGLSGVRNLFNMIRPAARNMQSFNNNVNNANNLLERLALLEGLEAFSRGLERVNDIIDRMGAIAAGNLMAQRGGLSRTDQMGLRETLRSRTGSFDTTTSIPGQLRAGGMLAEAGFRKDQLRQAVLAFSVTIDQMTRLGHNGEEVAHLMSVLSQRLRLTDASVLMIAKQSDILQSTTRVSAEQLFAATSKASVVLQGALSSMSDETRKIWLMDLQSATSALVNNFQSFDMASFLESITTGPEAMQTRAQLEAMMGLGSGQLMQTIQSKGIGAILPGLMQALQRTATSSDPSIAAQQIKSLFGPGFAGIDPSEILALRTSSPRVLNDYANAMQRAGQTATDFGKRISDTYTYADRFNSLLENMAEHASFLGVSFGDVFGYLAQFRVVDVLQSVAGIAIVAGPAFRVVGKLFGGLRRLGSLLIGRMGGGFAGLGGGGSAGGGVAGGAAAGTAPGASNWLSSGISAVTQAGRALIDLVGFGLERVLGGLGRGIGLFLQGLSVGLSALATPQVLGGTAVFALIAAGVWILGKAAEAAAPAITALMGGMADVFHVVLTGFAAMDWKQILAAGPAMTLLGLGFSSMMLGISAGITAMTLSDGMTKFAAFFGVGKGKSMGDTLQEFIGDISGLAGAMSSLRSIPPSGYAIPLPTFSGDIDATAEDLKRVENLYTRARAVVRDSAKISEEARAGISKQYLSGFSAALEGSTIENLVRRIVELLEKQGRGSVPTGGGLISGGF